jgi:hypothetical protein
VRHCRYTTCRARKVLRSSARAVHPLFLALFIPSPIKDEIERLPASLDRCAFCGERPAVVGIYRGDKSAILETLRDEDFRPWCGEC